MLLFLLAPGDSDVTDSEVWGSLPDSVIFLCIMLAIPPWRSTELGFCSVGEEKGNGLGIGYGRYMCSMAFV